MKNTRFGIEIEFTGITRSKAAQTIAEYFAEQQRTTSAAVTTPTEQETTTTELGRL